mgnify:CR=1 FL=1
MLNCNRMGVVGPANNIQQMPPLTTVNSTMKGRRMYQRGLSKHRMKVNKYNESGNTQRNGITATS